MPSDNEQLFYVTKTLEEHQTRIAELYSLHHGCREHVLVELAKLKVKAGTWGAIGGGIPVIVAVLLYALKRLL